MQTRTARRPSSFRVALAAALLTLSAAASAQVPLEVTTLESGDPSGSATLYGFRSYAPSLSTDALQIAFVSEAPNLVAGDTNGVKDIFLRDRSTGITELISQSTAGALADGDSHAVSISRDGRFAVFSSSATTLVAGDDNDAVDIFVRDRLTGVTERVSVDSSEAQADLDSQLPTGRVHSISDDGRYVVFTSAATGLVPGSKAGVTNVFVRDRVSGTTEQVDLSSSGEPSNGYSEGASISADGSIVAFSSRASNLLAGDTNGIWDVFVHDRTSGLTECISKDASGAVGVSGSSAAALSGNGEVVAYVTSAPNLVPAGSNGSSWILCHDLATGLQELVSVDSNDVPPQGSNTTASLPSIDDEGRWVAFRGVGDYAGSGPWPRKVYVRDRLTGVTTLASLSSDGSSCGQSIWYGSISPDGRYVGFDHLSACGSDVDLNGKHDVYLHDRRTGGATLDITNFVAGQVAQIEISGVTSPGLFVLGWSLGGQAPVGSAFGILQFTPTVTAVFAADAQGSIGVPIQLAPATLGLEVWAQGLDVSTSWLSEPYFGVVQ